MDSRTVRNEWMDRAGEYSPAYYAHYGSDATSDLVCAALDRHLDGDAAVLELGCSSGRHLAHLAEHGFGNLSGVDINAGAFDVMEAHYPTLAAEGTFYCDSIEGRVGDFEDGQFDAVYSVETLQHLHPDAAWVFEELARITNGILLTVENEGAAGEAASPGNVNYVDDGLPLYYRDWNRIFTALGFVEVDARPSARDTARTFRAPG